MFAPTRCRHEGSKNGDTQTFHASAVATSYATDAAAATVNARRSARYAGKEIARNRHGQRWSPQTRKQWKLKRAQLLELYQYHSGKASDVARQLAFAGIATIWLFHVGDAGHSAVPTGLIPPLEFLSIALGLDFLHYAICALVWGAYHRIRERRRTHQADDKDADAPRWINWPGLSLFWLKLIAVTVGQFLLILYIARQWGLTS